MNLLAAQAEMAMWPEGSEALPDDRCVTDSYLMDFSQRMCALAEQMFEIYGATAQDYIRTMHIRA